MTHDELIERMAQTIRNANAGRPPCLWEHLDRPTKDCYRRQARTILSAITDAGYAVVPVEATEQQLEAALASTTDDLPETVQYALIRGLSAMGWAMPGEGSREVMSAALRAMVAAGRIHEVRS